MTTEAEDRGDEGGEQEELIEEQGEGAEALAAAKAEEDRLAAEAAAAAAKEKEEKHIPKARFDEAVKKERTAREAAEKRASELEAKVKAGEAQVDLEALTKEIDDLEEQLEAKMAEGTPAERKALRGEIRARTEAIAEAKAEARSRLATAVAVEQVRYDNAVSILETQHPEINPDDEGFDAELAGEILELKGAYEATGLSSTEALRKAVKYVFKVAPTEAKKEEEQVSPEVAAKRKEEAVKKGLEARKKQPPAAKGVGADSSAAGKTGKTVDVAKMSDKDFDAVDKDELARMRGDNV